MIPSPSLAKFLLASAFSFTLAAPCALAQSTDASARQSNSCQTQSGPAATKIFYLTNVKPNASFVYGLSSNNGNRDADELQIALRNMLCPSDKIFFLSGPSAILVQAAPEQLALAEKLITELDRPRKTFRLVYTITELDADKSISTQHLSTVVVTGQHSTMKEGNKVPVATGSYSNGDAASDKSAGVQTQFTYLDVGMNFDSSVEEVANGVRLQSKIELSSLGQPSNIAGVTEPVVRQTVLEGTSFLTLGKPIMLGSADVPNSTHHFDIAVVLEPIK